MAEKEKNEEDKSITPSIVVWSIGIGLFVIGTWLITFSYFTDWGHKKPSETGEMFGVINALYSGLAFAGIIITILIQRKELEFQRNELKQTREEFIKQNKTLNNQTFDNIFFNMLQIHHQIVEDIDLQITKPTKEETRPALWEKAKMMGEEEEVQYITIKGRDVFKNWYNDIGKFIENFEDIENKYMSFYEETKTDLSHYFRNLYRTIKTVHDFDFYPFEDEGEKKDRKNFKKRYNYIALIRAQLSDYELLILFFNCLSDNGKEKFKPLVENYSLFDNFPEAELADKSLMEEYNEKAFDSSKIET